MNLEKDIIPVYPGLLVNVLEGVAVDNRYTDGFAEVKVDQKLQGEYMNICQVIAVPVDWPDDVMRNAEVGDFIGVWATAIKPFKFAHYGNISIVRNPDVFVVVREGSELYDAILENRHGKE